ncbi:MAG: acyltransferase family protein [Pseudomonadota bacterium]
MSHHSSERIPWVDASKGICILLVVMFHANLHITPILGSGGVFDTVARYSAPFRMPDFFLICGLFLSRRITAPLSVYLDRKVVHFAYFYWLWILITCATIAPGLGYGFGPFLNSLATSLIYPQGWLWFIYCLPICFLIARVAEPLPRALTWLIAAGAHVFNVPGEPLIAVYLSHYFVFFYTGFVAAPALFELARRAADRKLLACAGLATWAFVNGWIVFEQPGSFPGLSLLLGLAGGCAITVIASLLSTMPVGAALSWLGSRSIVVYLGFFIPLRFAEQALLSVGLTSADLVILIAIVVAIAVPLALHKLVLRTGAGKWLFERPSWARMPAQGGTQRASA